MRLIPKTFYLFFCLVLFGCDSRPKIAPLAGDATILAFGDSLTHGTGVKSQDSYPVVLAQLTGLKVINDGIPGNTTQDGLNRIERSLETHQPDLVLLCLGGNDFLRKVSRDKVKAHLSQMIESVKERNVSLILIAVPEPGLFLSDSELFESLAIEHQIPLLENTLSHLLSDNRFKSDSIHLNKEGYKLLASAIENLLKETGAL